MTSDKLGNFSAKSHGNYSHQWCPARLQRGQVLGRAEGRLSLVGTAFPPPTRKYILIMKDVSSLPQTDQVTLLTYSVVNSQPRAFSQLGGHISAWASYTASQFNDVSSPLFLKTDSSQVTGINKDTIFKDLNSRACCQLDTTIKIKGHSWNYRLPSDNDAYGVTRKLFLYVLQEA